MKRRPLHPLFVFATLTAVVLSGAAPVSVGGEPSDADLLEWAKRREHAARITADPVKMADVLKTLCAPPNQQQMDRRKADPHVEKAVHVYATPAAEAAFWDRFGKFPEGTILLKEKLAPQAGGQPELFTGMVKRAAGFFPECGDWEFFTLDGPLTRVTSRGKLASCADCHRDHAAGDFVTKAYAANWEHGMSVWQEGKWQRGGRSIAAGSSGIIYLPASRATTHGPKGDRTAGEAAWWKANPSAQGRPPEDLSAWGGPRLRYEPSEKKNTLGYWTSAEDSASWEVDFRQAGEFTVEVLQGCGKGSGGAEVALTCDGQTLTFLVEDTGHFQNFKAREVGRLTIGKPGVKTFAVKPRSKPGAAVMDLRQVVLRPVAR
jgi:hypothetical protein